MKPQRTNCVIKSYQYFYLTQALSMCIPRSQAFRANTRAYFKKETVTKKKVFQHFPSSLPPSSVCQRELQWTTGSTTDIKFLRCQKNLSKLTRNQFNLLMRLPLAPSRLSEQTKFEHHDLVSKNLWSLKEPNLTLKLRVNSAPVSAPLQSYIQLPNLSLAHLVSQHLTQLLPDSGQRT